MGWNGREHGASGVGPRCRVSRRACLAGLSTIGLAGLAGCSDVLSAYHDRTFGDVYVGNDRTEPVGGSIEVEDESGEVLLDEAFDLAAGDGEDDRSAAQFTGSIEQSYRDVWEGPGTYHGRVELTEPADLSGTTATHTVDVDDPEWQFLATFVLPESHDEVLHMMRSPAEDGTETPTEQADVTETPTEHDGH